MRTHATFTLAPLIRVRSVNKSTHMHLTLRLRVVTLALGLAIAVAIFDTARYLLLAKP